MLFGVLALGHVMLVVVGRCVAEGTCLICAVPVKKGEAPLVCGKLGRLGADWLPGRRHFGLPKGGLGGGRAPRHEPRISFTTGHPPRTTRSSFLHPIPPLAFLALDRHPGIVYACPNAHAYILPDLVRPLKGSAVPCREGRSDA